MSRLARASAVVRRVRTRLADIKDRRLDPAELDADVIEHAAGVTAIFDAPGVEPEDVDVRFLDGRIVASADRRRESYDGYRRVVTTRRLAFAGEVPLPDADEMDAEGGEATVRADGTLEITVPRDGAVAEDEPDRVESPAQN